MNRIPTLRSALMAGLLVITSWVGAQIDRSQAPEAGPAPKISIGSYDMKSLDNGLTLIVVENHRLPVVSWSLTLDIDPVFEGRKAGYVDLAGSLMTSGTASRSKADIDEAIDFIGARVATSPSGAFATSLSKHSNALLEVFADVILNPSFPQSELEKARKQALSGLQANQTDPGSISANMRAKVLFGDKHPYGEVETESSIEAIVREDLVNYHQTYFRPNVAYLVVVGDITAEEAEQKVVAHFGEWKRAAVDDRYQPIPARPEGNQVCFADLPGAVQSVVQLTHVVDLKPGHPDAIAASVMNSILGGGAFSGRLMQNLREDKAFTYGARSSLSTDPVMGRFTAFANVRNEVTDSAVVEFLHEIERMTQEPVDAASLETTLNYMTGSFARSLEQPETVARFALNTARYDLPEDYYATYLEKLNAVTAADVQRMAEKYLRPENLYITVVGNREEVAQSLARFDADGEMAFYDAFGNLARALDPAPEGMTAADVFNLYYTARGGADKLEALKGIRMEGSMEPAPGMSFSLVRETIFGQATRQEVTMMGAPVMSEIATTEAGRTTSQGTPQAMDETELLGAQQDLYPCYLLHLEELGLTAELVGIDGSKSTPVLVVELKGASGTTELRFDLMTSLLVSETSQREGPMGNVVVTVKYAEYEEVKGLKFPMVAEQSAGGQTMPMRFDNIALNPKLDANLFELN